MGRSAVRVVVRLRPTDKLTDRVSAQDDGKTVMVSAPQIHSNPSLASNGASAMENHAFRTDMVLKDASQETVYETCALDVVKGAVAGYNGCVLAYGQTGAGKTYSVCGGTDYRTRGIIPRAIKSVFEEVIAHADRQYTIQISFIEIYNDRICDLLDPASKEDFAILEDAKGQITVRGATMRTCSQEQEALSCLFLGNQNRTSQEHSMNANSSRSHAIFTIHVSSRSRVESDSATILGKVYLVDLAGSERLSVFGEVQQKTLKEAQHINKSLTFLEQVVMALGSAHRSHVPFRQSKLTNILKDALGGNSRTTMIANIWPEERNIDECISTLKFATRMMRVQNEASVNVMVDPQTQVKQLQRQLSELKAELHMQNQLMGKSHVQYEGEVSEDERFEMEKTARQYLAGKLPEIPVRSLREVKEYFRVFKAFSDQKEAECKSLQNQVAQLQQQVEEGGPPTGNQKGGKGGVAGADKTGGKGGAGTKQQQAAAAQQQALLQQQQQQNQQDGGLGGAQIGTLDPSSGQGLGVAAPSKNLREMAMQVRTNKNDNGSGTNASTAREQRGSTPPPGADNLNSNVFGGSSGVPHHQNNNSPLRPYSSDNTNNTDHIMLPPITPPNRGDAFNTFKATEGSTLVNTVAQRVETLKEVSHQVHYLAEVVNSTKKLIDDAQLKLQRKQNTSGKNKQGSTTRKSSNMSNNNDIDDEEFDIVDQVKKYQEQYRAAYDKHTEARRRRDNESKMLDNAKKQLLDGFEKWYNYSFVGNNTNTRAGATGGTTTHYSAASSNPRFTFAYNNNNSTQNSPSRFGGGATVAGGVGGGGDELDEGEKFDQLELQRVMGDDPESVAFFQAKKLAFTSSKQQQWSHLASSGHGRRR